ncbi:hypothetical protein N9X53_03660 [Mariniblastus sp.]|nr:hypothetical protein [Mariniblastus sp.]
MKHNSTFGLLCKEILDEFIGARHSEYPFHCLWQTEKELAKEASKCIPDDTLSVNPEEEKTYILHAEEFALSHPTWLYIRDFKRKSRTKLKLWRDNRIGNCLDPNSHKEISKCLQTWLDWDETQVRNNSSSTQIPPEFRTKPLTKIKAARAMGKSGDKSRCVTWLSKCINDGLITAERMNRQSYIFDTRDFPSYQHSKIK